MAKSKVAILRTKPATVLEDYHRLLNLAGYQEIIDKKADTGLKVNISSHIFSTTTGAMKNAFGGLLNEHRHWTHPVIHETLVDLLMIQKKIHRGLFAVMDGTFAGDGPGPRCMVPYAKDVILASSDQVAIDAMAAKLMGFDPMSIKFIRMAHDLGLG